MRIYNNNSSSTGSINNDKVARAILQYRNTPLPNIQLSPGQILFRQLRDHIPSHPSHYRLHQKWIISAKQREEHLSQRDTTLRHQYDKHSQLLTPLPVGIPIVIQNRSHKFNRQWLKTGFIVEVLPNRQYKIRMHTPVVSPFKTDDLSANCPILRPQSMYHPPTCQHHKAPATPKTTTLQHL